VAACKILELSEAWRLRDRVVPDKIEVVLAEVVIAKVVFSYIFEKAKLAQ